MNWYLEFEIKMSLLCFCVGYSREFPEGFSRHFYPFSIYFVQCLREKSLFRHCSYDEVWTLDSVSIVFSHAIHFSSEWEKLIRARTKVAPSDALTSDEQKQRNLHCVSSTRFCCCCVCDDVREKYVFIIQSGVGGGGWGGMRMRSNAKKARKGNGSKRKEKRIPFRWLIENDTPTWAAWVLRGAKQLVNEECESSLSRQERTLTNRWTWKVKCEEFLFSLPCSAWKKCYLI